MTRRTSARGLAAAVLLVAAAGAAFTLTAPAAASAQGTVLGGFRPMATDDANVQGAGAFLAEQVGGELASVDSAQYQGMLNTNYRVEITLADGARWSGQMTRDRNSGEYSMMGSPAQIQPATGDDEPDTGSNQAPDDDE